MKQPEEKRKLILIEQAWEDESGQYHDEYAVVLGVNKDGNLKLRFMGVSKELQRFLNQFQFKAEDYEDQLNEK